MSFVIKSQYIKIVSERRRYQNIALCNKKKSIAYLQKMQLNESKAE